MPAYVTYPQAVLLILQRIGQTPLQQVKSVKTANAPTGAKAGLLATVLFVAGAAYKEIPGVKEAVSNVGTWANDVIRNFTGPLDQALGGTLSSISFNPTAGQIDAAKQLGVDVRNFAIAEPPGLNVSGLLNNGWKAANEALDNMLGHTNRLAGLENFDAAKTATVNATTGVTSLAERATAVDSNMLKSVLDNTSSARSELVEELTKEATRLGKNVDQWVSQGLVAANAQSLALTNGKLGIFSENLYESLKGQKVTALQAVLQEAKDLVLSPGVTQLQIDNITTKLTTGAQELAALQAQEEATIQNHIKATALLDSLQRQALDYNNPVYKDLAELTTQANKKDLLNSINTAIVNVAESKNPSTFTGPTPPPGA